jgi:hypothetical protein
LACLAAPGVLWVALALKPRICARHVGPLPGRCAPTCIHIVALSFSHAGSFEFQRSQCHLEAGAPG